MEYTFKNLIMELSYKKRKTIGLEVNIDGEIKVSVPIGVTNEILDKVLEKKYNWLVKKREELIEKGMKRIVRKYITGENYFYLGKEYKLKIVKDIYLKKPQVNLWDDNIIVYCKSSNKEQVRQILEKWYRSKTLELSIERIKLYTTGFFDKEPLGIQVKEQKRRWASCTYDNKILINWRCSMAPIEIVDYIIVHELCHMDIKNHSKDFWNRVKEVLPDYKIREQWLKENGVRIEL